MHKGREGMSIQCLTVGIIRVHKLYQIQTLVPLNSSICINENNVMKQNIEYEHSCGLALPPIDILQCFCRLLL